MTGGERRFREEMSDGGRPLKRPEGFYLVGLGWAYFCPKCCVETHSPEHPRNGLEMRAWCCGAWKTKVFSFRDALTMPRGKETTRSFPVIELPREAQAERVVYVREDVGGLW